MLHHVPKVLILTDDVRYYPDCGSIQDSSRNWADICFKSEISETGNMRSLLGSKHLLGLLLWSRIKKIFFVSVFKSNNSTLLLTIKRNVVYCNIVFWEKKNMFFFAHSSRETFFSSIRVIILALVILRRVWAVENRFLSFNTKPSTRS